MHVMAGGDGGSGMRMKRRKKERTVTLSDEPGGQSFPRASTSSSEPKNKHVKVLSLKNPNYFPEASVKTKLSWSLRELIS